MTDPLTAFTAKQDELIAALTAQVENLKSQIRSLEGANRHQAKLMHNYEMQIAILRGKWTAVNEEQANARFNRK